MAATKSRACAISSARQSCVSVALSLPKRRFCPTVPLKRYAVCGTSPMRAQSPSRSRSRTSRPSTSTTPDVTSKLRVTRLTTVLFPEPVPPMIAVVRPGRASNVKPCRTGRSPCGYANVTSANATSPESCCGVTGRKGSAIDDVVSRTSTIRCALASARGTRMTMKTAVMTAKRICMMLLQERGQVADRHVAAVDEPCAEPQDRDRREIHDREKGWEGEGEDAVDAQRGRGEVRVRRLEPRALGSNANERPHDPYAGDLFPKHLRDPVDLHLDLPEKRDRHPHQHADDRAQERDHHADDPRQRRVLASG